MARIVTVYSTERRATELTDMSNIRWLKISEALARLGHRVDMATAEHKWRLRKPVIEVRPGLRRVPISQVDWREYDVVKTLFHRGFETLERHGGAGHPFVIAKLGSVVGPRDMDGIYFLGRQRERMFRTQGRIDAVARFVTVLSEPARSLWTDCHGRRERLLLVPGAVDAELPAPTADPYPEDERVRCLFAGNFYSTVRGSQPEAHRVIARKLNELGRHLVPQGARLYALGPGDAGSLDPGAVTYLGSTSYERSWDFLRHAHVGVVVSAGAFMHNNESTKIYHYLRVGLPVVLEAGFPNEHVVREAGLGFVVDAGSMAALAARVVEAAHATWNRDVAVQYILDNHTWDRRARTYDRIIRDAAPGEENCD